MSTNTQVQASSLRRAAYFGYFHVPPGNNLMMRTTGTPRPDRVATTPRKRVLAAILGASLALCACSGQGGPTMPNVILSTPSGPVALHGQVPGAQGGGQVGPPPGMEPSTPGPMLPAGRDGTYSGTAEPLVTAGGMCLDPGHVTNFRVRGNSVRFGQFRGTIAQDGGLQMVSRGMWLIGQFNGATFHGQLTNNGGRFDVPGCVFILSLSRTGP